MRFIGRSAELAFLDRCYQSNRAELVFVYGRRRIGKTECLRQFSKDLSCIWYSCTKEPNGLQLKGFSRRLLAHLPLIARHIDSFGSWQDAFEAVASLDSNQKKLIIIDEFPYAVAGDPSLPSVLQNVWDELLCRSNVMIVLCGSSVSFMEDELLSEKNPLYGRATGVWKMEPLGFDEAARFFPNFTAQEQLEAYGILGGVPHYLQQFDPDVPIGENVKRNVLSRGCALYTEADFLLRQELREPSVYNAVLTSVATGETELNGIAQKTLLDPRTANTYLKKLQTLRIADREFSVTEGAQERSKLSRGLWRINDNFIAFWYAAVQPWISELDAGGADLVWEQVITPNLNAILSHAFEDICRQWLVRQNACGRLPQHYQTIGRWWRGAHEIDLVALAPGKQRLLAECKFKNSPVGPSLLKELEEKERAGFGSSNSQLWLFSKNGFTSRGSWAQGEQRVRLVAPEELAR